MVPYRFSLCELDRKGRNLCEFVLLVAIPITCNRERQNRSSRDTLTLYISNEWRGSATAR